MVINAKKNPAVCVLAVGVIGIVKKITTTGGCEIPWVDELGILAYLWSGQQIQKTQMLTCSTVWTRGLCIG